MQKMILIALLTLFFNLLNAQVINPANVPLVVRQSFATKFFGTKAIKWEKVVSNYAATYKVNQTITSALFDSKGNLKELASEIGKGSLPGVTRDYCTKNFPGFSVAKVQKVVNIKGVVTYLVQMSKGNEIVKLLFDNKGMFLKKI